jgi:hypothetical protein
MEGLRRKQPCLVTYHTSILPFANSVQIVVGLKAPSTGRDPHSEVRRDWKQLIGRKPAHTTAVKTGLGEPPERGIPRRIELRQIIN